MVKGHLRATTPVLPRASVSPPQTRGHYSPPHTNKSRFPWHRANSSKTCQRLFRAHPTNSPIQSTNEFSTVFFFSPQSSIPNVIYSVHSVPSVVCNIHIPIIIYQRIQWSQNMDTEAQVTTVLVVPTSPSYCSQSGTNYVRYVRYLVVWMTTSYTWMYGWEAWEVGRKFLSLVVHPHLAI